MNPLQGGKVWAGGYAAEACRVPSLDAPVDSCWVSWSRYAVRGVVAGRHGGGAAKFLTSVARCGLCSCSYSISLPAYKRLSLLPSAIFRVAICQGIRCAPGAPPSFDHSIVMCGALRVVCHFATRLASSAFSLSLSLSLSCGPPSFASPSVKEFAARERERRQGGRSRTRTLSPSQTDHPCRRPWRTA